MSWEPILVIAMGVFLGGGAVVLVSILAAVAKERWQDRQDVKRLARARR